MEGLSNKRTIKEEDPLYCILTIFVFDRPVFDILTQSYLEIPQICIFRKTQQGVFSHEKNIK